MAGQGKVQRVIDSYGGIPCTWIRPDDCPIRPGEPCGQIHQCCRAHVRALGKDGKPPRPERLKKRGDPCGRHAMTGQMICKVHGGNQETGKAKGAQVVAEEKAARAVNRRLGRVEGTPVTDPGAVLADAAGQAIAWRDAAQALVADLEEAVAALTDDTEDAPVGIGIVIPTASGLDVHPLVKLVERAQDRVLKVTAEMVKLGFDQRRVQIEEAQADALQAALTAVLADHGIDADLVLPDLAARLHAIEAEAREA